MCVPLRLLFADVIEIKIQVNIKNVFECAVGCNDANKIGKRTENKFISLITAIWLSEGRHKGRAIAH